MVYDEKLADKIRQHLKGTKNLAEKKMFGGIAFMVNGKMCVGVDKNDMMLRCEPEYTDELVVKKGARHFNLSGKTTISGWLLIGPEGTATKKDFDYWVDLALDFNKKAKASKKRA